MSDSQPIHLLEFEEFFDGAPCGFLVTTSEGRISRVNETFATWMGRPKVTLEGTMAVRELLAIPSRIYFDTHLDPLLRMQGYFKGVALDFARGEDPVLATVVDCKRKDTPDGDVHFLMTIAEATDRRQYERELLSAKKIAEAATDIEIVARQVAEQASRAKDDILAVVSHELKNPLAAILGWTQVLRKKASGDKDLMQGLDVIERNTRVQARLIEDLLDVSRVISGKLRLDVQTVNLSTAIEAALETIDPAAGGRHIRLQRVLDPGVKVSGDPARLQQVFWNLLSNAVKFTGKGGLVRVVMERINSHIDVKVIDSGQGMSAELLPRIFDRFRQSESSSVRGSSGLGLGLSLVKNLVEMHGGSIEARSEGEGKGSTFVVSLPVIALDEELTSTGSHPQLPLAAGHQATTITLPGLHVLVVDDDADAREILKRMLTTSGARVTTAGSSEEALEKLQAARPNALVSDIEMPGIDGYELIRRIRMRGDGSHQLPAIALTALSRIQDRTQALLAGFQIHLAKPVDANELVVTIASLVNRLR